MSKKNVSLLAIALGVSSDDAEALLLSVGYAFSGNKPTDRAVKEAFQRSAYIIKGIECKVWRRIRTSLLRKQKDEED